MIICKECGSANADGSVFCRNCKSFLDWEAAEKPPASGADQERSGAAGQPAAAVESGAAGVGTGGGAPAVVAVPPVTSATPVTPATLVTPATSATSATAATPATEPTAVPQPGPKQPGPKQPGPKQPGPVQPGGELPGAGQPDELAVAPPVVPPKPGPPAQTICQRCQTPNDPTRRFCRQCGAQLAAAADAVPERRRWWHWLWPFRRRRYAAGERMAVRQPIRVGRRIALVAVLAASVAFALLGRSWIASGISLIKDATDRNPITPVSATASSSLRGANPERIFDGVSNTYWAPAKEGPGEGQSVEVVLPQPVRLLDVIVHSGISAERQKFLTGGRAADVQLTMIHADSTQTKQVLQLRDQPGEQRFGVRESNVVRVRLTIRTAYGIQPGRRVAIAEIELYGRR
jgi:ribosomal protein L40E